MKNRENLKSNNENEGFTNLKDLKKVGITLLIGVLVYIIFGLIFSNNKTVDPNAQSILDQQKQGQPFITDNLNTSNSSEVDQLRQELEELKKQVKTNQTNSQKTQTTNEISSADIQPYLGTIGVITCFDSNNDRQYGTGVLLKSSKLMTNWHVVSDMNTCLFANDKFINPKYISTAKYRPGAYLLDLTNISRPNVNLDFAIVPVLDNVNAKKIANKVDGAPLDEYLPVNQLDYRVGNLKNCSGIPPIGTAVAILGYPASSLNIEEFQPPESVTTGIISGYTSGNYLVSARVDHGNSGGLALGKEGGKICFLGMPTWIVSGQNESAGIVQNVSSVK